MGRRGRNAIPGLDEVELGQLNRHLEGWWPSGKPISVHELSVTVDDGYSLYTSYAEGRHTALRVGRARLHEELAVRRLEELEGGRTRGLHGLFYPGATPSHEVLLQAALYFDEVFVIHPGSTLLRIKGNGLRHPTDDKPALTRYMEGLRAFTARLEDFDVATLPLKRAGVLRTVPPQMQKRADFIELITADTSDPEFQKIVETGWNNPVFVAATKMEPLLPLVEKPTSGKSRLVEMLRRRSTYANYRSDRPAELFSSRSYGVKEVEPVLAASILLNHAFLLSEQHGLLPFTDDLMCVKLMQRKLKRVVELPGAQDFRRALDIGTASLSMRVLEEYLPRFKFASVEDVLTAREKLAEQLDEFRRAMAALAAAIEESPYDAQFERRVEQIVATKVRPAITALEQEIRTSRDGFIAKCVRNTQVGTVPIIGSIFAGLPASAVIAISAGLLTFEAAIETYMEISRKRRNGFTLLLKKH